MNRIEPVSEFDAPEILFLIHEYFPYVAMDFDKLLRRIRSRRFVFHKSMDNGKLAGYAEWEVLDEKKKMIRLNGIVVYSHFRGRKHATELLNEGEKTAQKKGMKKITLLVAERNRGAQKLYEKNGYAYARPHIRKINGEKTEVWEKELK